MHKEILEPTSFEREPRALEARRVCLYLYKKPISIESKYPPVEYRSVKFFLKVIGYCGFFCMYNSNKIFDFYVNLCYNIMYKCIILTLGVR